MNNFSRKAAKSQSIFQATMTSLPLSIIAKSKKNKTPINYTLIGVFYKLQ